MFQGWTILALLFVVLANSSGAEVSSSTNTRSTTRPILVGYDPAWIPFSYRDASGQFRGLDADLDLLALKLPAR